MQHPLAEIYLELMRDQRLWTGGLDAALRTVIATANTALGTQRIGLWSFGSERERLTLRLGYDAHTRNFEHGAELQCKYFPNYFQRLELVQAETITDAQNEPRLREFAAQGLINPELKAMLSCIVRVTSNNWGVFVASDFAQKRQWTDSESWFIASVANLIAQLITYAEVYRNERWLRFIADNLPIGILKFDLDAQCDYANPHWQQLTGGDAETAYGDGWLRYVHGEDRALMLDKIRMVGVSGERDDAELRLLAGGKTIWVACSWMSERDIEGMPIAILGTFVDVTYQRTLRENERRYRALFDNSGDAIFLVRDERFIDCNARALEMFVGAREQIIDQSPYRLSPQYQADGRLSQEKGHEKIVAALNGERQFFEWQHLRLDGSQFTAEVTLNSVTLDDEPHLLAAVRDISARKNAEEALRQSNERLKRINNIAARLYGLRDIEAVACASVDILAEHGSAPLARFLVYDAATKVATLIAQRDGHGSIECPLQPMQWVLQPEYGAEFKLDAEVDVLTDLDALPLTDATRKLMRERDVHSIVYIWLYSEAERIGLVILEYREAVALEGSQRDDLVAIGKAISTALSNVLFIARLEQQSNA